MAKPPTHVRTQILRATKIQAIKDGELVDVMTFDNGVIHLGENALSAETLETLQFNITALQSQLNALQESYNLLTE